MAKNLLINGRSAVHKDSGGMATSLSVNWTKIGKHTVPIPYTVVSQSKDSDKTAKTVFVNGNPVCNLPSIFTQCKGDEPGRKKGIMTGTQGDKSMFVSGSPDVYIEGQPAVRSMDLMTLNNGNTPPTPLMQNAGLPVMPTKLDLVPELEPPEQAHELGIRLFGKSNQTLLLQHQGDTALRYLGNSNHLEADTEQGMASNVRTTDNLEGGDYHCWLMDLDADGASQYQDCHIEAIPALEAKSGWLLTPIPALLSAAPMGDAAAPLVDLMPIAPARVTTENTLAAPDTGWLYLFINGYLWRELAISEVTAEASQYRDVNLITEQGKDTRQATGTAQESVFWVPKQINGEAVDLRIAYSNEQWSWDYIRRLGGMDPENDPRYIAELHDARELPEAPEGTPTWLIPDPAIRLTPVDLSEYDANQSVTLPEPVNEESSHIDAPTPADFPVVLPLSESGLSNDIFTDAERATSNPQQPVVVLHNPLYLAMELATQYHTAWGLFNTHAALYSDPAAAEALANENVTLDDDAKDQLVNDAYRFQSARLLHQLLVQQPEALAQPTGDAEQDQANQAQIEKLTRWRNGLHKDYQNKLEDSLKKFEFTGLKQDVMRRRQRLIDYITDNQAAIDAVFLDMAARQDTLGYQSRYDTASLLFGQLKDTVQSWEHTVFGSENPLNGEADRNADGIALYRELMENDTLYSRSLLSHESSSQYSNTVHGGSEASVPDGIGGFDGNLIRHWVNRVDTHSAPADAIKLWDATIKIMNVFLLEGTKLYAPLAAEKQRQQAEQALNDLHAKAQQVDTLQKRLNTHLKTPLSDSAAIEQRRQAAQQTMTDSIEQVSRLQEKGDDVASALAAAQYARQQAFGHYRDYAEQVARQRSIAEDTRLEYQAASRALEQANNEFDTAFAQLNQARQQLLNERTHLRQQHTQQQAKLEQRQAEFDAANTTRQQQAAELKRLQTTPAMEHYAYIQRQQQQRAQQELNRFTSQDLRLARQNLADAQLAVKNTRSQLQTNQQQLDLHGVDAAGNPIPLVAAATASGQTSAHNHRFYFRLARTSAIAGSPVISLPVFAFELSGANTRPGTHPLLASAQAARLTEQGVLPKLASIPNLNNKVRDVAALLYLYDSKNRQLSHLKADLKRKFDTILALDQISAEALKDAGDMASFNRLMEAYYDERVQYSAALETAAEQLENQMAALDAEQRRADLNQFQQAKAAAWQAADQQLNELTEVRNQQWQQWREAVVTEHALNNRHSIVEAQNAQAQLTLQSAIEQLRSAEEAIGIHQTQAATAEEIRARVTPSVQAHLNYLQRGLDRTIPYKAQWRKYLNGEAKALSFLAVLGALQAYALVKSYETFVEEPSILSGIELVGSAADSLAIIGQVLEKLRLAQVGAINPLLRVDAARMAREFLRGRIAAKSTEGLPEYLKIAIQGKQAPAFQALLIKTVLIASAVNVLGAVGASISGFSSSVRAWQSWRSGEIEVAQGYGLMALGSALQVSSSITALQLGFFGANATRFMLFASNPFTLIAGVAITGLGLLMTMYGADGMVTLLSRTSWGTSPYSGQARWRKDAAAEWVDLVNLFQNPVQTAAHQGFLRCDQPIKAFEVMLPGFTEASFATLTIEHRLATWLSQSQVYDAMQVRKQTLAIYHSPEVALGTRLTQQLRGYLTAGNASTTATDSNLLPYQMLAEQSDTGLRLTFRFNHFDFFTLSQPFTQHTIQLRSAFYPYGRDCTVGRHQTLFANPAQPEYDVQADSNSNNEITSALPPLVTGVVDGTVAGADYWVTRWQQEGQTYQHQHQIALDNNEQSDWQQGISDPADTSVEQYLGAAPAMRPGHPTGNS